MNNFLDTKIKIRKKLRRKSDRNVIIFLIIFFTGYIFFFTTNLYFPVKYKITNLTAYGERIKSIKDFDVSLVGFDYGKKEEAFDILLNIDSITLKPLDISAYLRNGSDRYKCTLYKKVNDTLYILRGVKVPKKIKEIELDLKLNDESTIIYSNDTMFKKLDNLNRTDEEYIKLSKSNRINAYENVIKELDENTQREKDKIKEAEDKIKDLENSNEYKINQSTVSEKINKLGSEKKMCETNIETNKEKKEEYQGKIKILKEE